MKAAMIGTGLIGRSFAMIFAKAGYEVSLYDAADGAAARAREMCREGLATLAAHGLCDEPKAALARIVPAGSIAKAVDGATHVQENVFERLDVKRAVFPELDAHTPEGTVIASSTSAIMPSAFTEALPGRHRCLVAHPVNPPHLAPIIELVGAPWTSAETVAKARATFEAIGQTPIVLNKEIEGFVLNRLQAALVTEAFRLVQDGVASPRDIDATISEGLGLRWSFMGPFQTGELNAPGGLPDYCARFSGFLSRVSADLDTLSVWSREGMDAVIAAWGDTGPDAHAAKSAERDRRLAALVAHKQAFGRF